MSVERAPAPRMPGTLDYLEGNILMLPELGRLHLFPSEEIGSGSGRTVYSAGSYISELLDDRIHLALKLNKGTDSERVSSTFITELATMTAIARQLPRLSGRMPLFHILVRDQAGAAVGSLTEDFTEGGVFYAEPHSYPYPEILRVFADGTVVDDFRSAVGAVFRRKGEYSAEAHRRMVDFYPLLEQPFLDEFNPNAVILREDEIGAELDKHTLFLDYELKFG